MPYVATPTDDMYRHIYRIIHDAGFGMSDIPVNKPKNSQDYLGLGVDFDDNECYNISQNCLENECTYTEFLSMMENHKKNSLKINDEYTTVIDRDNKQITVGCQQIPFSVVDELYNLINE